jgi:hypothetical protein
MPDERREGVTRIEIMGQRETGGTRGFRWKAAVFGGWHEPDDARVSRPGCVSSKASMFSREQSCQGRSQNPVVRIAEGMETEPSKPIDKAFPGKVNESPGRNKSERVVASKVKKSEGRAHIRRAKAA